jgi:PAS domain-containing protein
MRPVKSLAVQFVTATCAARGFAFAPVAGNELDRLRELFTGAIVLVETGYHQVPALVFVFGALLILPLAAIASLLVHLVRRRRSHGAALRAAERRAQMMREPAASLTDGSMFAVPAQAWLSIDGQSGDTIPVDGKVIRIGRHEENDICLNDTSVHRYHAIIERTNDEVFVITDLSGEKGNGIRVNGERLAQVQLTDGDVIDLGRARLRFECTSA